MNKIRMKNTKESIVKEEKYNEKQMNGVERDRRERMRKKEKTWLVMHFKSVQTNQFNLDFNLKNHFWDFKKAAHNSRKCAQLGLTSQDGSLSMLLRIMPEPLQLRTDHRQEWLVLKL